MFTTLPVYFIMIIPLCICIPLTWYSFVVLALAVQQGFVAEEWIREARNNVWVEANLHAEVNKALGASEQKNKELNSKLLLRRGLL